MDEDFESRDVEFRRDGWPLCPECGEDELFSLDMPATPDSIVGCYRCAFQPDGWFQEQIMRRAM